VTVVIPVRDRAEALARCLAAVGPAAAVLVVDDASARPEAIGSTAAAAGAQLIRRTRNGGPAAARNTGLAASRTPLVAFVDSDCAPEPGWLEPLLRHFADPAVAAVAPRIVGFEAGGWLGAYERLRSSLDMGERPGRVAPLSRIAYLPAAALVVRRSALGRGFDERLRLGEDVDLMWRLHSEGQRVRYEPVSRVRHDHRVALADWARRRYDYGTSAGQLARRHPGHVPPAVTSVVALAPLVLAARGQRPAAAVAVALGAVGLARRLPPFPGREREAARLMAAGMATTTLGISRAATRAWLPLTLALLTRSARVRMAVGGTMLAHPLASWVHRRPALDPLRWSAAYLLDDAAYCAGLWVGALGARTAGPLLPAVPEWPSRRAPQAAYPPHTSAEMGQQIRRTGAAVAPTPREGISV
jgi:mycofactocin system glycosyltransferase